MSKRDLKCSCCGNYAGRWEQHHAQDKGYGLCEACVPYITAINKRQSDAWGIPVESLDVNYGKSGVNRP